MLRRAVAVLLLSTVAACVPPGTEAEPTPRRAPLTFAPASPTEAPVTPSAAAEPTPASPSGPTDQPRPTSADPAGSAPPSPAPRSPDPAPSAAGGPGGRAAVQDSAGDVEPGRPLQDPPPYADLVGADLTGGGDAFTLRVQLRGGAPQQARDGDHTLNVAAYYDVDGDGYIDYETWANLAAGGWGSAWYDDDAGQARFGADDDVEVSVDDGALVLRFPASALGGAGRFRWALTAEWGTYEDLQLRTMSFDAAPDQGPVRYPGG